MTSSTVRPCFASASSRLFISIQAFRIWRISALVLFGLPCPEMILVLASPTVSICSSAAAMRASDPPTL
jgi:hypothetical protein